MRLSKLKISQTLNLCLALSQIKLMSIFSLLFYVLPSYFFGLMSLL
jgi:hypothetical protein